MRLILQLLFLWILGLLKKAGYATGICGKWQLQGQPGTPRESIYMCYSPRQQADLTAKELAFDHRFKLYRDGRLFDLEADRHEKSPLSGDHPARAKLQAVLDQYKDVRPVELDRQLKESRTERPEGGVKRKKAKAKAE